MYEKREMQASGTLMSSLLHISAYWFEVAGIQALGEREEVGVDESESRGRKLTKKQQKEPNEGPFACPSSVSWLKEIPQTDFYIKSNIMTVLAMDGRRRVMDIENHVSAQATNYVPFFQCL